MNITGRKERAARDLLQRIKKKYKRSKDQFITYTEFCAYTGLPEDLVRSFLV
jgi:hypothetical protein